VLRTTFLLYVTLFRANPCNTPNAEHRWHYWLQDGQRTNISTPNAVLRWHKMG